MIFMRFFCKVSRATQETSHMRNRSVRYFVKTPGITFLRQTQGQHNLVYLQILHTALVFMCNIWAEGKQCALVPTLVTHTYLGSSMFPATVCTITCSRTAGQFFFVEGAILYQFPSPVRMRFPSEISWILLVKWCLWLEMGMSKMVRCLIVMISKLSA